MTRPDRQSQTRDGDLWERLIEGLERDDQLGADHLKTDRSIRVTDRHTSDSAVIKQYPDRHHELARIDCDGEHIIGPLPAVKPRI